MPREQFQHVVEETNPGRDLVLAFALDGEFEIDARFGRVTRDDCRAAFDGTPQRTRSLLLRGHCLPLPILNAASASLSAVTAFLICSRVPIVMRTRPSHPGSLERSRTSTPATLINRANSACCVPISTRM